MLAFHAAPGFTFHAATTDTAEIIVATLAELPGSSVQELSAACVRRADCGGFTTSGQLKGSIGSGQTTVTPVARNTTQQASAAAANPCAGLYVRSPLTGA